MDMGWRIRAGHIMIVRKQDNSEIGQYSVANNSGFQAPIHECGDRSNIQISSEMEFVPGADAAFFEAPGIRSGRHAWPVTRT